MTDNVESPSGLPYRWPPRIFFNTDGCLAFKYLCRRDPGDVTEMMIPLADTGVDVVCVLVGINDDLSWRGSAHGELWGETWGNDMRNLLPSENSSPPPAGTKIESSDLLQMNLRAMVDDGHDVFQLYVDRARKSGLGVYASIRMNDAHCNMEHRMADARRSAVKMKRPDLLIGSPAAAAGAYADDFNFSWQWDYGREEVRQRFLGRFDEILSRYEVDGLELDFCRGAPFFKPHQEIKQVDTMTAFMRQVRQLVGEHGERMGREVKFMCRVASSFDASLELGLDAETWVREGVVDIICISSAGGWRPVNDVDRAVAAADAGGTLVYVGSGGSYPASPQNGYDACQPAVRRAIALNAYEAGASGVHLFNHDYANHRANPVADGDDSDMPVHEYPAIYEGRMGAFASDRFTRRDLQNLRDLADPNSLRNLDRCYQVSPRGYAGDYEPQIPRKLALIGRGAGDGHLLHLRIEDEVEDGIAEGRIWKTEMRLRMTEYEANLERIVCEVNDQRVDLQGAARIHNRINEEWLVVDDPPLSRGSNRVLVVLDGSASPDGWQFRAPGVGEGWPTLHQCELLLRCERE